MRTLRVAIIGVLAVTAFVGASESALADPGPPIPIQDPSGSGLTGCFPVTSFSQGTGDWTSFDYWSNPDNTFTDNVDDGSNVIHIFVPVPSSGMNSVLDVGATIYCAGEVAIRSLQGYNQAVENCLKSYANEQIPLVRCLAAAGATLVTSLAGIGPVNLHPVGETLVHVQPLGFV